MSRTERRVTFWLKVLLLIAVSIYLLVGVLEFLGAVRATALLFVGALFLAYLIHPLVRRLNEKLPLGISILLVYVAIGIVAVAIVQILIPALASDLQGVVKSLPQIFGKITGYLTKPPEESFIARLPLPVREVVAAIPTQMIALLQSNGLDAAQKTITVVFTTVSVVASAIVIPVLAAYMLMDAEALKENFLGLLPEKKRAKAEEIIADLDHVVGGFIRGQLIDGSILGTMLTVMLWTMHVPYALLIGVVSGALNFIPYAGAVIAFVPAVILALTYNGLTNAIIVAVLIFVIHQIDGNFVAPRVLKENVGLSPFWIVISILGFSELFGLAGTFLAVPVAAMIRVLREHLLPRPVARETAAPELTQAPLEQTRPPVVRR